MSRIKEITERHGIPFVDKKVEGADVVRMLEGMDVFVDRGTVYDIRSGRKPGTLVGRRIEVRDALSNGGVGRKDDFYHRLADTGIQVRGTNKKGHFSTVNFTSRIAEEMDIEEIDVSRCLRAMRTEMVLSEKQEVDPSIPHTFLEAASNYFRDFRSGYESSRAVGNVDAIWNKTSMEEFYRACELFLSTPQAFRTWMPYEVVALQEFYKNRSLRDSMPSSLDILTVEKNATYRPSMETFVAHIQTVTGIKFDSYTHYAHINVLLHGLPTGLADINNDKANGLT